MLVLAALARGHGSLEDFPINPVLGVSGFPDCHRLHPELNLDMVCAACQCPELDPTLPTAGLEEPPNLRARFTRCPPPWSGESHRVVPPRENQFLLRRNHESAGITDDQGHLSRRRCTRASTWSARPAPPPQRQSESEWWETP